MKGSKQACNKRKYLKGTFHVFTVINLCHLKTSHQAGQLCTPFLSDPLVSGSLMKISPHICFSPCTSTLPSTPEYLTGLTQSFSSSLFTLPNHVYLSSSHHQLTFKSSQLCICQVISQNSIAIYIDFYTANTKITAIFHFVATNMYFARKPDLKIFQICCHYKSERSVAQ